MKILLHAALICGTMLGTDYSAHHGANTRALLNGATPQTMLGAVHLRVHHYGEAIRRQIGKIVE